MFSVWISSAVVTSLITKYYKRTEDELVFNPTLLMIHQKRHNKSSWTQSSPTRRLCVTSTSVMIRAAWAGCGLVLAAGPSLAQADALALSSPLAPQPVLLGWKPASTPLHSRWMETQVRTLKIPWQSSTRTENQAFVETWRRFRLFLQSSSLFCVPASSNQTGMKLV